MNRWMQLIGHAYTGTVQKLSIECRDGRIERILPAAEAGLRADAIHLDDQALILPGLHDAHVHLLWGGLEMDRCRFSGVKTLEEFSSVLSDYAGRRDRAGGEWIQGSGVDETRYRISRVELDRICPDVPVFLWSHDLHSAFVNSAALVRAGIFGGIADPESGRFERDSSGVLNGVLRENACLTVERKIPAPSGDTKRQAMRRAQQYAHSLGITAASCSVHREEMADYLSFAETEDCRLRLNLWRASETFQYEEDRFAAQSRTGFRYATLKGFTDGALGSRSAAFWEPYEGVTGAGEPLVREGPLARYIRSAHQDGFQVALHAIGDRANSICLDAIEMATSSGRGPEYRPRIEHAQVLRERDFSRFAEMGVIASMQPIHCTADMRFVEPRIGTERAKAAYAWRTLLDHGAMLAFGSDWPVENFSPLVGIHAAVTRQNEENWPEGGWQRQQRITVAEAVSAYTHGAAYAAFWEQDCGAIREGMLADFTVVSSDIFSCDPSRIHDVKVAMTVVGGEVVYRKN